LISYSKHSYASHFLDDLLLTPRALDAGLDSLKGNAVKRERKYQLM
jgi:hypothetical protein